MSQACSVSVTSVIFNGGPSTLLAAGILATRPGRVNSRAVDAAPLAPNARQPAAGWIWKLTRPVASVDVQRLLGDVVGIRRGEEDRGPGDVLRLLDAAERDLG